MDQILDLFVLIYLKCSPAVQLNFIDDIDKCIKLILEDKSAIFN